MDKKKRTGARRRPQPAPAKAMGPVRTAVELWTRALRALASAWRKMRHMRGGKNSRRLRVCDVASLGEKRFIAVVQFEQRRFLVGGGAVSVSLLSELENAAFAGALARATTPAEQRLVI